MVCSYSPKFWVYTLLLHLPLLGKFEEEVGRVEEASLEEEDEGNPLVVRLVLNL